MEKQRKRMTVCLVLAVIIVAIAAMVLIDIAATKITGVQLDVPDTIECSDTYTIIPEFSYAQRKPSKKRLEKELERLGMHYSSDDDTVLTVDEEGIIHAVGVGTANKGNVQHRQISGGVIKPTAQEHDALQTLFALHDRTAFDLVVASTDLLHDHCKTGIGDGAFNGADNVGVERIGHTADYQTDSVGLGAYQIAGAVVGNVVAILDGRKHLTPDILTDIRPVIQHTGDGTDADAALFGYILDRHTGVCLLLYQIERNENRQRKAKTLPVTFPFSIVILSVFAAIVNCFAVFLPKRTEKTVVFL